MSDEKIPLPPKIQLPPKISGNVSATPNLAPPPKPLTPMQNTPSQPVMPSPAPQPSAPQASAMPSPAPKPSTPQASAMPSPAPQPSAPQASAMPSPEPKSAGMPAPSSTQQNVNSPQPKAAASFADDYGDDDDVSGVFLSQPVKKNPQSASAFKIASDDEYDGAPTSFSDAVGGIKEEKPRVDMSYDGSDYYNEEEYEQTGDYYNTNSKLVVSRENWFLKIFKPLAWLGLVAGIIAAGVFAAPFVFEWFNENFEGEEIVIEQPTETPSTPIVEGGEGVVAAPSEEITVTETYSYNPEITGTNIGLIEQGGFLSEGSSGLILYTTEPAGDTPTQLLVQLDSVSKTEQFPSVLRGIKTASLGEAVAQGVDATEAEQQLENYRLNFVKINIRYDGAPLTFTRPQLFGTVKVESAGKIGSDVSESVLSYYTGPLGYSTEEAYAKIFEEFQCDIDPNFKDDFWNGGVSVQKCFVVASNDAFDNFIYTHKDYSMSFQNTYRE